MVALPFLLDGLALQWFRQNKSPWPTWAHFRTAFRARFGDINYQWRLDEQMASRFQGEDELAADYLTCLQGLYQKFERPVSLIEQMDWAYMNMRPRPFNSNEEKPNREIDPTVVCLFQSV